MPNATVRAAARTTPKPAPAEPPSKPPFGSIESIRQQTAELETATALLKVVQAVENAAAEPKESRSQDLVDELEMKIRGLYHLTNLVSEWASAGISVEDADGAQHDRLMWGLDEIAETVADVHAAFPAAYRSWRGPR
jgi:hypothetical protein